MRELQTAMVIVHPLEKSLSLKVLFQVFQNHRLAPPSRTSSFFPKISPHFWLYPSYLSSLKKPTSGGPCHKLSDNRSIPSLSSSFVSLPAETSMYNWSPVLFDFLLHPFCFPGNIPSFSRRP